MNIELSPLREEDIELVRTWRNSPDVAKYMYTDDLITEEQQKEWFENITRRLDCKYFIINYEGKKIGFASLTNINPVLQSCYWAFYLGETAIRGAGVGSKIEYNILNYVFEELKLNKLRCEVFVENDKVIKMHEKFGFRREAYYREHCIKGDKKLDVVGLAILKNEWKQIQNIQHQKIYENQP